MNRFKFFLERYKKECIAGVIFVILLIGGFGGFWIYRQHFQVEDSISLLSNEEEEKIEKEKWEEDDVLKDEERKESFRVDIKGEVKNPGVYLIASDARVIDVIEKAGGLTKNANTKANNLSRKVQDEMVIIIYSKSEIEDFSKTKETEKKILVESKEETQFFPNDALLKKEDFIDSSSSSSVVEGKDSNSSLDEVPSGKIDDTSSSKTEETSKISINTATIEELMNISGIGESKAKAIVSYRNENGHFKKIEDIMQVSGIGEKMFEKIKEFITV